MFINLKQLVFLFFTFILFNFSYSAKMNDKNNVFKMSHKIKKISFGKYDEYTFFLYEKTKQIVKNNKLVSAIILELYSNVQCEYKFVLNMPIKVKEIMAWNLGEWKLLKQRGQISNSISSKSSTHFLKDNIYTIQGFYSSTDSKGFIRGLYKLESLPIAKYKLDIYIDKYLIKSINFNVYQSL